MSKSKEIPKKRKTRRKKAIAISLVGVLTAGGVGGTIYYKQNSEAKMPAETKKAQSATAELGSISNTIVGTGNLALSDAQSQTIPSGIEIEEVMVESGDKVTKGDTIATVSKASVLKAVEETQEEIKELDEQISDCQDDDDTDSIDASVDGRVKLIYAETGDDITDVMLENGSILVLSLDGKMAVDIKASGLKEDDTVTVTLSSGTQVTGIVESVSGSTCTVTVTDNGTEYDDEVTVTDSNGKELGTGKLYIHEPLKVTGTTGTVSTVNVSENESVSSGTELFTLENSTSNVQYEQLLAEREAYSATLKKLLQLSKNQKITADISGTVQSVNVSANSSDSSSSNTSSASSGSSSASGISKMSYATSSKKGTTSEESNKNITDAERSYVADNRTYNNATVSDSQAGIIRLSSTNAFAISYISAGISSMNNFINTAAENTAEYENTDVSETESVQSAETTSGEENGETEFTVQTESEEINDENTTNSSTALTLRITTEGQNTANTLAISAPVTGNTPTEEVVAADGAYPGSISWNPGDGSFAAGTVYQANVILYAGEGYVFTGSSVNGIDTGVVSGVRVSADGSTLSFTITYPQTAGDSDSGNNSGNGSENNSGSNSQDNKNNDSSNGNSNGDSNGFSGADNSDSDKSGNGNSSDSTGGAGDSSGNNSQGNTSGNQNGTSGNTGTGSSGGSAVSAQSGSGAASADTNSNTSSGTSANSDTTDLTSSYSTEVEAFTISSDEDMVLAVSVDELDINSVEPGQEAVVELDAIEDETFTGEVTAIGDTASASGGVAKYTVSLTIPKDDRMKQGMNASATITIDSRENVVTIPVNALQEEGSKVFVYTEQDDDGNLSGEKEVTTGLSNGTTVEITEGLQEGETVYYNKTGNTQNSTSGSDGFPGGNFDGENGFPGGDMPSDKSGTRGGNNSQGGGNGQGGPGNMPNM